MVESRLVRGQVANERDDQYLATLNDSLHVRFLDAFCGVAPKSIVENQMIQLLLSNEAKVAEFTDIIVARLQQSRIDGNNEQQQQRTIDGLLQLFASRGRLLHFIHAIFESEVNSYFLILIILFFLLF